MSLRQYFITVFGFGTIFFLFLVSALLFTRMESIMTKQISSTFQVETSNKIKEIDETIASLNKQFTTMTQLPLFSSMRFYQLTLNEAGMRNDIRLLELYFYKIVKESDKLIQISYIDTEGLEVFRIQNNEIASQLSDKSSDENVKKYLQLSKGEVAHSFNYKNDSIESMTWWVPVYVSSNTHLGVMSYTIDFELFKYNIISMFPNSNLCITDKQAQFLITNTNKSNCQQTFNSLFEVKERLNHKDITWNIFVQNNTKELFAEINELKSFVFYKILPLISLLAFLFIYIFTDHLLISIKKLVEFIKLTGKSVNLDQMDIDVTRQDELGVLAREMQRSNELITAHRKKLEDTNNELESYSYTLAHDLRSPLRSIASFSQILQMESSQKLNEEEVDFLNRIINASKRMSELIDDILELSKISGKSVNIDTIDLTQMAQSVIENLQEINPDVANKITIEENMTIKGDPQLFKVILENLLGNAWKYSAKNDTIEISFSSKIEDGQKIYQITDNGVGFDMKYIDKLFKPFQRLHKAEEFEGTGIGLASVKKMMEKQNAKVWIDSKVDEGTTVSFSVKN